MKSIKILFFLISLFNIQNSFSAAAPAALEAEQDDNEFDWLKPEIIKYLNEEVKEGQGTAIISDTYSFIFSKIPINESFEKLIQYFININKTTNLKDSLFKSIILDKILSRVVYCPGCDDIKLIKKFLEYSENPAKDIEEIMTTIQFLKVKESEKFAGMEDAQVFGERISKILKYLERYKNNLILALQRIERYIIYNNHAQ